MVMDWVALLGSMVGILTFVFSAFHYIVLKPLKEAIIELRSLIGKVQDNIDHEVDKRHDHDIKINTLEQKLQALEGRVNIVVRAVLEPQRGGGSERDMLSRLTS